MALQAGAYLGAVGGSVTPVTGSAPVQLAQQAGLGRTPWVDKSMKRVWERLLPHVDEAWMPQMDDSTRKAFSVAEYGCGYYGCVLPTNTEGMVLKVTSDASEAMFTQGAINLKEWPQGMVQYKKVLALAGEKRHRRNLFLLWREEAHDIGYVTHGGSIFQPLATNLSTFKLVAQTIRKTVTASRNAMKLLQEADQRYGDWAAEQISEIVQESHDYVYINGERGYPAEIYRYLHRFEVTKRLALCYRICIYMGELMQGTQNQMEIGEALSFYASQGIVLADVHAGNVGRHEEFNGDFKPVITDPGQAVPMNASWLNVSIQVV